MFSFGSAEKSTATKATLGDEMSMYYDEKLKRWVDPVRPPLISVAAIAAVCGKQAALSCDRQHLCSPFVLQPRLSAAAAAAAAAAARD